MDRNFFLALALSFLVLTLWMMWEGSQRRPAGPRPGPVPEAVGPGPAAPEAAPGRAAVGPEQPLAPPRPAPPARRAERRLTVTTPLYEAELSSRGGGLVRWTLAHYRDASRDGEPPVVLTTLDGPDEFALTTPFEGVGLGDLSRADFAVEQPDEHTVRFTLAHRGVSVIKQYRFDPDSYAYRLRLEVRNGSALTLLPTFRVDWPAALRPEPDFSEQALVVLEDGSVERARVDSLGRRGFFGGGVPAGGRRFSAGVEWAGVETRYFLAVLLPEVPRDAVAQFEPVEPGRSGVVSLGYAPTEVPAAQSAVREYRGYIGPKEPERLAAMGQELDLAIDRGWRWVAPLTRFFAWLLHAFHSLIPNYGVGIIALTVLVRLATAPLTTRQMRSMKKMGDAMRVLQPKIKAIQERYKDDRQRQSQEMMALYREAGVNPLSSLGGCLPLLLQFPVFIGLYYALRSSIDLRQAPFVGWMDDLSQPETLFVLPGLELPVRVLPVVMGASMIVQQKLTPSTMDPAQARMMMTMMPVMFTVLFYQFPSGLVLYWLVSNLLAIVHQFLVNRQG